MMLGGDSVLVNGAADTVPLSMEWALSPLQWAPTMSFRDPLEGSKGIQSGLSFPTMTANKGANCNSRPLSTCSWTETH